jgi:uncharacterized membrane protein YbhN (UPF0104 family)
VTLLAERSDVAVLPLVAAGLATHRDAMLVIDASGHQLSDLPGTEVDDRLLTAMWTIADTLNERGIAHGGMDTERFVLRPDGSLAIGDFSQASVSADDNDLLADRAQLLVSTALLVDHERAVAVADAALGHDRLAEVLPFLQPAAVDRATRRTLRDRDWDLGDLRQLAADTAGVELPKLEQIRRVTVGSVATVVVLGLVAYGIISALAQVGLQSLIDEFKGADWAWLLAALLVTPVVQIAQAFSTMGASVRPVRLLPVLMLEYAIQFIGLAVPSSAARVALEIRFFQKFGVPTTGAAAIGVLDSVCGFVVQIVLILSILLSGLASLDLSTSSSSSGSAPTFTGKFLVIGIVVVLLGVVVLLAVPKYREIIRAKAADGTAALRVLRSPSKLLMIFGGNLVAQILLATILGLCVLAFGHHLSLAELILINTVVSLFAGFMPVPGGMGVAEAGYTAGLVAFGIPHTAALSIALAFRLVTFYLPPIWGGFAMRWLRQHSYV